MNKSLIAALLLVFGGALYAQGTDGADKAAADKKASVAEKKTAAADKKAAAPAVQPKKAVKAEPAKAAAAKQDEQDAEESVVMIDSKAEVEEAESAAAYGADQDERAVPGGLPLSYGQCKGIINDAGRSLLVFESPDDGTVSFVQVTIGRSNVSWKLVDRIPRSVD